MIKKAFEESRNNCRFGDTIEEISEIQDYIIVFISGGYEPVKSNRN